MEVVRFDFEVRPCPSALGSEGRVNDLRILVGSVGAEELQQKKLSETDAGLSVDTLAWWSTMPADYMCPLGVKERPKGRPPAQFGILTRSSFFQPCHLSTLHPFSSLGEIAWASLDRQPCEEYTRRSLLFIGDAEDLLAGAGDFRELFASVKDVEWGTSIVRRHLDQIVEKTPLIVAMARHPGNFPDILEASRDAWE